MVINEGNKIHACVCLWREIAERHNEAIHTYGINSTIAKSLVEQHKKSEFIKFNNAAGQFEVNEDHIKGFVENNE